MRGTGPVTLNGVAVYAYFTATEGATIRLRVSVDESDRLGLSEGHRVRVGLPDREPVEVLVTEVRWVPPVVWLDLRPLA
ncbi:MAG TPA: hypothetical protein VM533_21255 [Fimbriiglobus sp.]|nr:hypothetical protein [Fimbriiglobus sp.]